MADASGGKRRARPGGHDLRREVVAHHQRQRILTGAALAFSQLGYRQVKVSDIVSSARIARNTFYDNFASKQDCFFALYDDAAVQARHVAEEACERAGGEFSDRVRLSLAALLGYLESDLAMARAFVLEGPAVGPAIDERFERMIGDFATLLRKGRDQTEAELSGTVEETVVGGLYWLLYDALLEEEPEPIGKLLPQLVGFALIPFLGAEAARGAASPG